MPEYIFFYRTLGNSIFFVFRQKGVYLGNLECVTSKSIVTKKVRKGSFWLKYNKYTLYQDIYIFVFVYIQKVKNDSVTILALFARRHAPLTSAQINLKYWICVLIWWKLLRQTSFYYILTQFVSNFEFSPLGRWFFKLLKGVSKFNCKRTMMNKIWFSIL